MDCVGKNVVHDKFGNGTIIAARKNEITVKFLVGNKRFIYPDAFENGFLRFCRKADQTGVERDIKNLAAEKTAAAEEVPAKTFAHKPQEKIASIDESRGYWKYRSGNLENGKPPTGEELVPNWAKDIAQAVMQQKLEDVGDIRLYNTKDDLAEKRKIEGWDNPGRVTNAWNFCHEMQVGDIVFSIGHGHEVFAVGIVDGDYFYQEGDGTRYHKRKVKWFLETQQIEHGFQQGSLSRFDLKNERSREKLENLLAAYGKYLKQ